ncbi:MAG: DUF2130 domain-containing protein [Alphaproteobacteria bacterium]
MMIEDNEITCPHCNQTFALQESVAGIVEKQVKMHEKEWEEKTRKKIQQQDNLEKADLKKQLEEKNQENKEKDEKLLQAMQNAREAKAKEDNIEITIQERVATFRQKDKEEIEKSYYDKQQREIAVKEKDIEKKYADEVLSLKQKNLSLEKLTEDTNKELEEIKRKQSQGSQQAQGEALEWDFAKRLKQEFSDDKINEVPKGIEGADLIQEVYYKNKLSGIMLWETKNTKNFSQDWIRKLKTDQTNLGAEVAIIATNALPKGSDPITNIDGIYVVSLSMALPVAMLLRRGIIRVSDEIIANEGKEEKAVIMYKYLTSTPFKQKIEAIISAYQKLLTDTDKEERAMKKIWSERKKSLQKVIDSTVMMYGEMQSIAGQEIPTIEELELDEPTAIEE